MSSPAVVGRSVAPVARSTQAWRLAVLGVLVLSAAALAVLSLAVGSVALSPGTVWSALRGDDVGDAATIVLGVRVPRTVLGLLVGSALGSAGAVMQGHTRNPLADPGLLGVTAGATVAVVLAIFVLGIRAPATQVWFAMAGAAIASLVVMGVAEMAREGSSPVPLALAGVAVSALLGTVTSFVVLSDEPTLDTYRRWVVGSLSGRNLDVAAQVWPFLTMGLVLAMANARAMDLLGLGVDVARGLGQRVALSRLTGLSAVTMLTGAATAAAGPIGFLGLVVPHAARRLVGIGHRWVVPCSALLGAVLLLAADVGGRLVPGELQVGVLLALVGGPVFLLLVRRHQVLAL